MAYGIQFSTDMMKIGDSRLKTRGQRRLLATRIERASVFGFHVPIADMDAGDKSNGPVLLYNCVYVGGYIELAADDDGTVVLEKWDDPAGSTQVSICGVATLDGGVSLVGDLDPLVTVAAIEIPAGQRINIKTATFDGTVAGAVTMYFKLIDDVEGDDT